MASAGPKFAHNDLVPMGEAFNNQKSVRHSIARVKVVVSGRCDRVVVIIVGGAVKHQSFGRGRSWKRNRIGKSGLMK